MSPRERIPRQYRGTDLESAFLDGREDAVAGRDPSAKKDRPLYCEPEWEAYKDGWTAGRLEVGGIK